MLPDSFDIRHISYYEPDNKIWGWFTMPDPDRPSGVRRHGMRDCYCFWGVVGKTISLNKHYLMAGNMTALEQRKSANKYQTIEESMLLEIWPTFREDLSNRYVFYKLRDSI